MNLVNQTDSRRRRTGHHQVHPDCRRHLGDRHSDHPGHRHGGFQRLEQREYSGRFGSRRRLVAQLDGAGEPLSSLVVSCATSFSGRGVTSDAATHWTPSAQGRERPGPDRIRAADRRRRGGYALSGQRSRRRFPRRTARSTRTRRTLAIRRRPEADRERLQARRRGHRRGGEPHRCLCRRIPNVLTAAAIALRRGGSRLRLAAMARSPRPSAALGGLAVFFPFFALGGMGGGDVKLMAALGAWLGWQRSCGAALYTAMAGGVLALAVGLAQRLSAAGDREYRRATSVLARSRACGRCRS